MSARENGMGREGGGNRRDSHPLWGGPAQSPGKTACLVHMVGRGQEGWDEAGKG